MKRPPLIQRMQKFFADNPDEELTLEDACIKFDASKRSVEICVSDLLARPNCGVERVRILRRRRAVPLPGPAL